MSDVFIMIFVVIVFAFGSKILWSDSTLSTINKTPQEVLELISQVSDGELVCKVNKSTNQLDLEIAHPKIKNHHLTCI